MDENSEPDGAANIDDPEPIVREKEIEEIVKEGEETQSHPWIRFFARGMDYIFFGLVLGIITGLIGIPYFASTPLTGFLFMIFAWCFVEAACISGWRTTPGKAILGVSVQHKEGNKLSYGEALSRSLSVWFLGMAAGLPIIMFITWIVACIKLSNEKVTSWDRRGNIAIYHKNLHWIRITVTILIYLGYGALIFFYGRPR